MQNQCHPFEFEKCGDPLALQFHLSLSSAVV
jgi:hypothetical protein